MRTIVATPSLFLKEVYVLAQFSGELSSQAFLMRRTFTEDLATIAHFDPDLLVAYFSLNNTSRVVVPIDHTSYRKGMDSNHPSTLYRIIPHGNFSGGKHCLECAL